MQLDAAAAGAIFDIKYGGRTGTKLCRNDDPYTVLLRLDLQGTSTVGELFGSGTAHTRGVSCRKSRSWLEATR